MSHSQRVGLLILLLLPAYWLRLFLLDSQSLWWDEGISLHLATATFAEIAANRAANIHPPLYFFLLKIWVSLTGTTPFAARYSSVLGSFMQMALVYAVLRRWFGRSTAVIGLVLTAVWSLSIIYAQEVRVYAFLPLVYLLLLLLTQEVVAGTPNRKTWLWLGLVEWIALHLHYNALFLLIFINGWLSLHFWRQEEDESLATVTKTALADFVPVRSGTFDERKRKVNRWLKVQIAVGLASLPWAVGVLLNWSAVQAEASLAGFSTQPPAWDFVLPQVLGFHLTGLVNVLADPLVGFVSTLFLGLFALLIFGSWMSEIGRGGETSLGKRRWIRQLLLFWLAPLSLGFAVWLVRSYSHPRYISLFASGLVLLLAFLLTPNASETRGRAVLLNLLRLATAVCFIWLSGWGLQHYFFDPDFAKDDMRTVAAVLAETAVPTDLILVPRTDWSLPFTYQGDTPVHMADAFHQDQMWPAFATWTTPPNTVFTLDYADNLYDWQGVVPFALESAGNLVNRWQVDDLTLSQYRLDRPVAKPELVVQDGRFGALALLGSWVGPTATTADGVTVALQWQLLAPVTHNYSIVLNVADGTGLDFAYRDDQLVTANGRPTNRWEVGEIVTTFHFLPFAEGTPPVKYDVNLRVYIVQGEVQTLDFIDGRETPQGQVIVLGQVQVERPLPGQENVYGVVKPYLPLPAPLPLADGLLLTHASLDRSVLAPGEMLRVRLQWRAQTDLPDLRPRLVLRQAGQTLVSNDAIPAQGQFPTHLWRPADLVWEQRQLVVPAFAEPGVATLFVELGEKSYALGEVEISTEVRTFVPPAPQVPLDVMFGDVARLVGVDLPPESVTAGEPIPLTLYWQSLRTGPPVGYTVFTQVLGEDGRLIAQHDAVPANGSRPTTGWLEGEFIQDAHLLSFRELTFAGEGQFIVGLYDAATGQRLTLPDGGDAFLLPVALTILAE